MRGENWIWAGPGNPGIPLARSPHLIPDSFDRSSFACSPPGQPPVLGGARPPSTRNAGAGSRESRETPGEGGRGAGEGLLGDPARGSARGGNSPQNKKSCPETRRSQAAPGYYSYCSYTSYTSYNSYNSYSVASSSSQFERKPQTAGHNSSVACCGGLLVQASRPCSHPMRPCLWTAPR